MIDTVSLTTFLVQVAAPVMIWAAGGVGAFFIALCLIVAFVSLLDMLLKE